MWLLQPQVRLACLGGGHSLRNVEQLPQYVKRYHAIVMANLLEPGASMTAMFVPR